MIAPNRSRPLAPQESVLADQAASLRSLALTAPPAAPTAPSGPPVICICSGKGGVGKTMLAVNMSLALASRRRGPLLLDADLGTPNADLVLGLNPVRRFDPGDQSASAVASCVVHTHHGLRFVPGAAAQSLVRDPSLTQCRQIIRSAGQIDPSPGLLLVDAGAGVGRTVLSFASLASLVVVVATPDPTSIADAYAMLKALCVFEQSPQGRAAGLVINQVRNEEEARATFDRLNACARKFLAIELLDLGSIPADEDARVCVRRRVPMMVACADSAASRAVLRVAERVERALGLSDNRASVLSFPARILRRVFARGREAPIQAR